MRKLKSLCKRLRRDTGLNWCVVSHRRGQYAVFCGLGFAVGKGVFSTVADCERFLISQFR